jgi:serine acetyltransferase
VRFLDLVLSDARRIHPEAPEPRARALALLLPRLLVNPSLQLAFLVRCAQCGPVAAQYGVRWLQVVLFSSEIYWFKRDGAIELGPGISFPHPFNIIIGPGTRVHANVTIYNNTGIGSDRDWRAGVANDRTPTLREGCVVHQYTAVQGPYDVGERAVVGAYVVLDGDVPAGALRTRRGVKLAGEWRDERPVPR